MTFITVLEISALCTCNFQPEGLEVKSRSVTMWGKERVGRVSTGVRMMDTQAVIRDGETVSGVTTGQLRFGHVRSWGNGKEGHVI